jgi:hypothetical protein
VEEEGVRTLGRVLWLWKQHWKQPGTNRQRVVVQTPRKRPEARKARQRRRHVRPLLLLLAVALQAKAWRVQA